jgi:hypothetical protein
MSIDTRQGPQSSGDAVAGRRPSLRGIIGSVARSAFQLHHYRYVRTRVLDEALCRLDCRGHGK